MDAFFARNRLSAYLDGTLTEAEAAEVEDSLAQDPALRADYDAMRRAVAMLREVGPTKAPHGFHAAVMGQIAAMPVQKGALAWLRRPLARVPVEVLALAAAALIVVIAIQLRPDPIAPPGKDVAAVTTPVVAPPQPAPPEASAATAVPKSEMPTVTLGRNLPLGKEPSTATRIAKARAVTPKEPFVADWEKQGAAPAAAPESATAESDASLYAQSTQALSNGVGMRSALYYRVTDSPADVLQQLLDLARQTGGQLVDSQGQPISPHALTIEDNFARVRLIIPPGALSAASAALRKLGAEADPPPSGSALYAADSVTIHLELTYKP